MSARAWATVCWIFGVEGLVGAVAGLADHMRWLVGLGALGAEAAWGLALMLEGRQEHADHDI